MYGFAIEAITFYSVLFAVAFSATVAREVRDGDWSSCWHLMGFGSTAGFLSVGVVGILGPNVSDGAFSPWYWVGIAALLGLVGKEQDKIARIMIGGLLKGFRKAIDDADESKKGQA